jgi:hypothetical protein
VLFVLAGQFFVMVGRFFVMAGLGPAIHDLPSRAEVVDARPGFFQVKTGRA